MFYNILYTTSIDGSTVIDSSEEKKNYLPGTNGYVGDSDTFGTTTGITSQISGDAGWKDNVKQKSVTLVRDEELVTTTDENGDEYAASGDTDGHKNDNEGGIVTVPSTDTDKNGRYDDGDSYITKYAYTRTDSTFTLPQIDHNYYHFLGWDQTYPDDGVTLPGKAVLEQGSTGDRLYTAYWKDNLMTVNLNAGHTDGKHNSAWAALNKNIQPTLGTTHGSNVSLDADGTIRIDDSKKIHIAGAQDKIDLEDGNDASCINLYVPDYRLVPGMEWSTKDNSNIDSNHTSNNDETTYDQSKTYHSNIFDDKALRYDDADVTLFANWEAREYTITYDVGGTIAANVSESNASAVEPSWVSNTTSSNIDGDMHYDVSEITGSYNAWKATQLYTVETTGSLPKPDRNYYTFEGWYVDGKGSKKVETYEDLIKYRSNDDRNIELVAEWKPIEYELTYSISAIPSSVMDLTYDGYIKGESATTSTSILGSKVTSRSAINETFTGKDSKSYTINISIEATGNLAESHTDYIDDNGTQWICNGSNITTYKQLFDILSAYDNLSATITRSRGSSTHPATKFYIEYDFGTADWRTVNVNYNTSTYNIPATLNVSGAAWADASSLRAMAASDMIAQFNPGNITPSLNGGTSTYGKTDKKAFSVLDLGTLPVPSLTCHTFNGWYEKSENRTVSAYTDLRTSLPKTGSKTYTLQNGSSGKWETGTHTDTSRSYAKTCVKKGVTITYCTKCGNVKEIKDDGYLSSNGQHDFKRHTHLVKDTSGNITTYRVSASAPKNANAVYGGTGNSNGAYSEAVPITLGGAGTCYNGGEMTVQHIHSSACFTGQTAKTETITITIKSDGSGSSYANEQDKLRDRIEMLAHKYCILSVKKDTGGSGSSGSMAICPKCNKKTFNTRTGECSTCGYGGHSYSGGSSGRETGSRTEEYIVTYYDSCSKGYNPSICRHTEYEGSSRIIGLYRAYRLSCNQRYDRMCFADGHDIYTCKNCGEKEERGYAPAYGSHNMAAEDWGSCSTGIYHRDYCTRGDYSNTTNLGATHQYKWVTTSTDLQVGAGYWNGSGAVANGWVTDGWLSTQAKARENVQDIIKKRLSLGSRPSLTHKSYNGAWGTNKFTDEGHLRVEHGVYFKEITKNKKYKYVHYNLSQRLDTPKVTDTKCSDKFHIASLHEDIIEYKCSVCGAEGTAPSAPSFNFDTGYLQ